jgi:hypothetical protein
MNVDLKKTTGVQNQVSRRNGANQIDETSEGYRRASLLARPFLAVCLADSLSAEMADNASDFHL